MQKVGLAHETDFRPSDESAVPAALHDVPSYANVDRRFETAMQKVLVGQDTAARASVPLLAATSTCSGIDQVVPSNVVANPSRSTAAQNAVVGQEASVRKPVLFRSKRVGGDQAAPPKTDDTPVGSVAPAPPTARQNVLVTHESDDGAPGPPVAAEAQVVPPVSVQVAEPSDVVATQEAAVEHETWLSSGPGVVEGDQVAPP
jgi:hypothetical protein